MVNTIASRPASRPATIASGIVFSGIVNVVTGIGKTGEPPSKSLRSAAAVTLAIATGTRLIRFPSAADYVRIQLTATPLASQAGGPDSPLAAALTGDVTAALEPYCTAEGLAFPQETHVLMAHAF